MQSWKPHEGKPQERFLACGAYEVLYGGQAGGAKLSRLDATVWTPFGPRSVGELKAGDQICAPDGGVQRVLLAHPVQHVDLYRLTFSDGASTIVGEDHLWYAWIAGERFKAERRWPHGTEGRRGRVWTTTQMIAAVRRAERSEAAGKRGKRPIIPLCEPVALTLPSRNVETIRPVPPYTLGALLGDGTITERTRGVMLTTAEPLVAWEIGVELPRDGIVQVDGKSWMVRRSSGWKDKLRSIGALGYAHTKSVPRAYLLGPVEVRRAVLQGLLDTDGTADDRGHVSFTSVSRQLALDVQFLARSLGRKATFSGGRRGAYTNRAGERVECREVWSVYIQGHDLHDLFRLPRKRARCRPFNGGASEPGRRLEHVEFVGKDEARCITVDHPSRLFVTDDFLVTHNSESLIVGALRHVDKPDYRAVLFRRTWPEIEKTLFARAWKYYPRAGGVPRAGGRQWIWPKTGALIELATMEREVDKFNFSGPEYQYIAFDELSTFLRPQYVFLQSRLRATKDLGIPLRLRAATNPGGLGSDWVLERWAPWLYPPDVDPDIYNGVHARPEQVLWFTVSEEGREEWVPRETPGALSRAFFPSTIEDNPALNAEEYRRTLNALDPLTREHLAKGNWLARPAAGLMFKRDWFAHRIEKFEASRAPMRNRVRYWDRAATSEQDAMATNSDPDWTVGVRASIDQKGMVYIEDVIRFRGNPGQVQDRIHETAVLDEEECVGGCSVILQRDPAQAGKVEIDGYARMLAEFDFRSHPVGKTEGDKIRRAKPVSGAAFHRRVILCKGRWNAVFLAELEAFPETKHDDQVDALSGAYLCLQGMPAMPDRAPTKKRFSFHGAPGGY